MTGQVLISVIDDDASVRSALVGLVRSLGHAASGFGSAEEFLQADHTQPVSCIISDIQMPGMSGIELQQRLAADGCPAPMIMITARHETDLKMRALAGGAICFLKKPFEADALIGCIERALARPS